MNTKRALINTTALLFAAGLLMPTALAKAPAKHVKKAPHKAVVKKTLPTDTGAPPTWKPDPKLLATLGPEKQFGPFTMRIPTGYTVTESDLPSAKAHIMGYQVTGPQRKDGTFAVIFVIIGEALPGNHTDSADTLLEKNTVINAEPDLIKTHEEDGTANGLDLERQYYKYRIAPGSSHWIHGFQYATTDGQTYAIIGAMDAEPYNVTSIPLIEAAALTLRMAPHQVYL